MKLKKAILMLTTFALTLSLAACAGQPKANDAGNLNIYTWAEYIPQNVIEDFEAETGIKVNYTNFEANEEMLAKLATSKGGDYDIVIASDYIIKIASDEGLVKEIDMTKVPNYKNRKLQVQVGHPVVDSAPS